MVNKQLDNLLCGCLIANEWRLSRKFMRELMDEFGCQLPIIELLVSQNLQEKWAGYAEMN